MQRYARVECVQILNIDLSDRRAGAACARVTINSRWLGMKSFHPLEYGSLYQALVLINIFGPFMDECGLLAISHKDFHHIPLLLHSAHSHHCLLLSG